MTRALALLLLAAALGALASGPARAGRSFRNAAFRVEDFEVPRGWQTSAQNGYPKVLLVAYGPDGAKLILGAQRVTPGQTALDLAADARAVLVRQGFGDPRVAPDTAHLTSSRRAESAQDEATAERARLDATFDAGRQTMRQWYIVDVDVAIVVTVTTPITKPRALKDAEASVASLVFAPLGAPIPVEPPPAGPRPPDAGAR